LSDLAILAVNMLMVCHAADFAPPAELARLFVVPGEGLETAGEVRPTAASDLKR
jgi:hypothetical protein